MNNVLLGVFLMVCVQIGFGGYSVILAVYGKGHINPVVFSLFRDSSAFPILFVSFDSRKPPPTYCGTHMPHMLATATCQPHTTTGTGPGSAGKHRRHTHRDAGPGSLHRAKPLSPC